MLLFKVAAKLGLRMARNHEASEVVRYLVVGDAYVGKTTFVQALCFANTRLDERKQGVGCHVSVRVSPDGVVEEFYDICGNDRFKHGRSVFYHSVQYDGLILAHDLSDSSTRNSLGRIWVPETLGVLGDVKAVEAGGRHESAGPHVRSRGVLNELRVLWMHMRSKHAGLRPFDAVKEALRLSWRLGWLLLNEFGVWTDEDIDRAVEREMLTSSTVPVAVMGLKKDQAQPDRSWRSPDMAPNVTGISLVAFNAPSDAAVAAFLRRTADHARRRRRGGAASEASAASSPHVALPF